MNDKEKLSLAFYNILVGFRDTLSLPTHATLEKCMKLSACMFLLTVVCKLLGLFTFISWQGSLACTLILVALLWKERSENDALLRMYRNARISAQKAAQYAKTAGANLDARRRSAGIGAGTKKTAKQQHTGNRYTNSGRNGSSGGNTKRSGNNVPNTVNERSISKRSK